jgi:spore coat protein U-like protein
MRIEAMRIRAMILAVLLVLAPKPAQALLCGTVLDPISVSSTTLVFGNYLAPSQSAANHTVTISCGLGLDLLPSFTVALSAGQAASFGPRKMSFGAALLNYNIYTTPGFATVWGDGSGATVTQSFNGSLLSLGSTTFTGYGRVPAGQYVAPGGYTDTLTVTVTF